MNSILLSKTQIFLKEIVNFLLAVRKKALVLSTKALDDCYKLLVDLTNLSVTYYKPSDDYTNYSVNQSNSSDDQSKLSEVRNYPIFWLSKAILLVN